MNVVPQTKADDCLLCFLFLTLFKIDYILLTSDRYPMLSDSKEKIFTLRWTFFQKFIFIMSPLSRWREVKVIDWFLTTPGHLPSFLLISTSISKTVSLAGSQLDHSLLCTFACICSFICCEYWNLSKTQTFFSSIHNTIWVFYFISWIAIMTKPM